MLAFKRTLIPKDANVVPIIRFPPPKDESTSHICEFLKVCCVSWFDRGGVQQGRGPGGELSLPHTHTHCGFNDVRPKRQRAFGVFLTNFGLFLFAFGLTLGRPEAVFGRI